MSVEEAREHLEKSRDKYFDYLEGRVLKLSLAGDTFDTWGYDRDNGEGAASKALKDLLKR